MKRKLLCISLVALSVIGASSCKKDDIKTANNPMEISGYDTRGGGGGVDDVCQNPLPPTPLVVEKDGSNNSWDIYEGQVVVSNNADSVIVEYYCIPGFGIKNVRVWVGPKGAAPVTTTGNPTFGSFLVEKNNLGNAVYTRVAVPRSLITLGPDMIVIAHANVFGHNTESSYGYGPFFVPGGKAMYIAYQPCGWSLPVTQ